MSRIRNAAKKMHWKCDQNQKFKCRARVYTIKFWFRKQIINFSTFLISDFALKLSWEAS